MSAATTFLLCAALLSASTPQERRLRLQFDELAARASALIELVDSLQAELRQQGTEIHPDIASARDHLNDAMNSATQALEKHDWTELRKRLARARGWIEQLQRRL